MNREIDFSGARGSNTGDVYHELWAVRAALQLLDSSSGLDALVVEGVPSVDGSGSQWDGVDCTLLFGGRSIQTAERVVIQQLKYSASKPKKSWTPSRACFGPSASDPSSSLMRGLGKAFREVVKLRKGGEFGDISIELATNQPISDQILKAIDRAKREGVPSSFSTEWKAGEDKLHRLVHASGLSSSEFEKFANCLKFISQTSSRFRLEEKMLVEISAWTEAEFVEVSQRLRNYVRNKMMMPETAGEIIEKESILIQFGVTDHRALFPCPANVKAVPNLVPREISRRLCEAVAGGQQRLLLHGTGGVGKSTVLQELPDLLPDGSEVVVFDCYGAGSYMDASAARHRSRDAFVQLANELASRLKLPSFLEPKSDIDFARAFNKRLELAAETFSRTRPDATLLIVIDAADNSISAANARKPQEESFVVDLVSFEELPRNVALLISARTGRRDDLKLPSSFKPFELLPFTRPETETFVRSVWNAPKTWIDDFHRLTHGTPRVQNYAFGKVADSPRQALEPLRPNGNSLDGIFEDQFVEAVKKSGEAAKVEDTCAALAVLPRPIPIEELGHALELTAAQVRDICSDLEPGVRLQEETIGFADEDFESFALDKGKKSIAGKLAIVAKRLLEYHQQTEYAALNVVPLLSRSGMGAELLDLVESEPEPSASTVSDPVLRMEIRNQRLTTAIGVCRSAGNPGRAIRFILIGAEALETDDATRKILLDFPGLTSRFAGTTGSRLILGDPKQVKEHGRLLLNMLSNEALDGNFSQVREVRRRIIAWSELRDEVLRSEKDEFNHAKGWPLEPNDVANALVARALEEGARAAIDLFRQWPLEFASSAARIAIRRLTTDQRFRVLQDIGSEVSPLLAPFVLIPLRLAGQPIDLKKLAQGLTLLSRRYPVTVKSLDDFSRSSALSGNVSDVLLDGAEILAAHRSNMELVKAIAKPLWLADVRRADKLYHHQSKLIDSLLRSYFLYELCSGNAVDEKNVLAEPPMDPEQQVGKTKRSVSDSEKRLKETVGHVASFYARRAEVLLQKNHTSSASVSLAELRASFSRDHWQFDRNHSSMRLRSIMAEKLVILISANVPVDHVSSLGFEIAKVFWPYGESSIAPFFSALTPFESQHADLLSRVTAAVKGFEKQRMGAREKSEVLARFSEILVPISSADAGIVFQKAIAVAHELDSGSMDQIRFLNSLIIGPIQGHSLGRRDHAVKLAEFVIDAGIRLENVEHFPWTEAMESLTTLDFPTALACVARWDDCGFVSAYHTLEAVIQCGLSLGVLDFAQAAALLKLVERPRDDLIKMFLSGSSPPETVLVEEFAHDLVTGAVEASSEVKRVLLSHNGGQWLDRLRMLGSQMDVEAKQATTKRKPPKATAQRESVLLHHKWQQETLCNAEALHLASKDLLRAARDNDEYLSLASFLMHASSQVVVGNRVRFLSALVEVITEHDEPQVVDVLFQAISSWSTQLSVLGWCETALPSFVETAIPYLVSRYPGDVGRVETALELANLNGPSAEQVILRGLEKNGLRLTSTQIFQLTQFLLQSLPQEECGSLLSWYLDRLFESIGEEDREDVALSELPTSSSNAVARFLVACMSDVDLRVRWRASHAGRRLARLNHFEELANVIDLYANQTEGVFRAPDKPYYWLAARLWMVIMFDRICEEVPTNVRDVGTRLCKIALDESFPHILVRDYAADACLKLHGAGQLQLTSDQISRLSAVNSGIPSTGAKSEQSGSYDAFRFDRDSGRFRFDTLDTLRYWYAPWLRVFEGANPENFLEAAERWILDEWGIVDEKPYRFREPRENRFESHNYHLSNTSHGSLPTLERYRTHLEWHAKWCAAGEFLATRPLKTSSYDDGDENSELRFKVSYGKLTKSPYWLADFVTSHPRDVHHWSKNFADAADWVESIDDAEFLRELFPEAEDGWLVVDQYIDTGSDGWELIAKVNTGLVSPPTAMSLVRALQTCPNEFDFNICHEGHELEIDEREFRLNGWVERHGGDRKFDEKDPLLLGAGTPSYSPGSSSRKVFNLEEVLEDGLKWMDPSSGEAVFRLELWGDKDADERNRYLGDRVVSSGHRLLMAKSALATLLKDQKSELIIDIGITKRDKSRGKQRVFEETAGSATYSRILLLERSGGIRGAEKDFGAWREDST